VPNLREKANRYLGNLAADKCLGIEIPPQQYMAPWRKFTFVVFAITSWIYRWVVTFSILFFMATWLKPYKLEHVSIMLAVAALFSMVFWPLYRMGKKIAQRGRLPDMKRKRVTITSVIVIAILLAFFLLPLPINRVRETGLVQIQENDFITVTVPPPGGRLIDQFVQDGDRVTAGKDLASFTNDKLASKIAQLDETSKFLGEQKETVQNQLRAARDPEAKARSKEELTLVDDKLKSTDFQLQSLKQAMGDLRILKAPRAGVIMNSPKKEEMFKYWDQSDAPPFCKIGDNSKIRVLVPVTPTQYREIKENLAEKKAESPNELAFLDASILVSNRSDHIYQGRVTAVPNMHETNMPVGLTSRGGGPVAVRPSERQNSNEPVTQTYLIQVELMDPDGTLVPGAQAKVKIHLKWRTAASWVAQKIASALDVGLW
jgi:putative peptide zinc metalloprotease protein